MGWGFGLPPELGVILLWKGLRFPGAGKRAVGVGLRGVLTSLAEALTSGLELAWPLRVISGGSWSLGGPPCLPTLALCTRRAHPCSLTHSGPCTRPPCKMGLMPLPLSPRVAQGLSVGLKEGFLPRRVGVVERQSS